MNTGHLNGQGLAELRGYNFQNLSSAPTTNLYKGRFYFNTTNNTLYVYNGSQWLDALAQGTTYTEGAGIDITSNTISIDNTVTGATKCKITYNGQGLVTAGADLQASDIPNLSLSKITDVIASATEVNVLDGITASTAELNIMDGVTVTASDINSVVDKIELDDISVAAASANYLGYDNTTGAISANVDTTVTENSTNLVTSGAVESAIASAVASAVVPKASVATVGDLGTLVKSHVGWMYNMSAAFETTSDFVEGAGKSYPAGTNVVIVEYSSNTYKYDVFAGFVDTSAFITASGTDTLTNKTIDADNNTIQDLVITNFKSGTVVTTITSASTDTTLPTAAAVWNVITTSISALSYSANNPALTASGGVCTWTVTHNLNSSDVDVAVYEVSSGERVMYDYAITSANVVTVKILSASNISAGTYKVVVQR